MERVSVDIIEKTKNIALVVLVFTTILLLYFLWGDSSLDDFNFLDENAPVKKLLAEDVIVPKEIIISMGNGNYTVGKDEFPEIISTFKKFSKQQNLLVDEIPKEKYQEVMEYPSIRAVFNYNINFSGFCGRYGITQALGFNNISTLSELGFSKGRQDSVFIYDGASKKYFRIWCDSENNFTSFEDIASNTENTTYYPLKIYLGEESTNETLIPIELPTSLKTVPFEQDFNVGEKEIINTFAQTFFGESLDFVRILEESNGTVIFMYGYGQKILIISPDGSAEYKEEQKNIDTNQVSFFDALDTALSFVASHGGFKTVNGKELKPYLTEVSSISGEKNDFRFVFSFTVDGNKLYYPYKAPLTIEVTNGQVSYFRRNFIAVDEESEKQTPQTEKQTAINMLALNFENIKGILISEKEQQKQISFEQLANDIDGLYIGYYRPLTDREPKDLIPAWIVEIDGVRFFMDLYDGDWLGYSLE
ncbi:two-component system activity regulator YycH [Clostridium aminobutyricum]|uniref:Regulatory protein YycH domain-containing protein n=1 Tax=Clostridium aminobutyricum TaxID=33953 RepID=A0A939IGH5_CLOAM|nr:two-component system activity regulator YycH [Clostridium aminobutyricum]MBN7773305.1 hypothetical protein [Clostridium aminobutyricum]